MNLYFSFIIQLFIFFLIVTSVAGLFTKSQTKRPANQEGNNAGDSVEKYPSQEVEDKEFKRNAKKQEPSQPTKRPTRTQRERRERYERYQRNKDSSPIIKDVVTLSSSNKKKKKHNSTINFDKKKLKEAVIYKEILDKPLSLRDSDTQ